MEKECLALLSCIVLLVISLNLLHKEEFKNIEITQTDERCIFVKINNDNNLLGDLMGLRMLGLI